MAGFRTVAAEKSGSMVTVLLKIWLSLCLKMNAFWFQEFYNLDSLSLPEVVDLVETTRDVVDDVWRQTEHDHYPESRMLHLLDIIGTGKEESL